MLVGRNIPPEKINLSNVDDESNHMEEESSKLEQPKFEFSVQNEDTQDSKNKIANEVFIKKKKKKLMKIKKRNIMG